MTNFLICGTLLRFLSHNICFWAFWIYSTNSYHTVTVLPNTWGLFSKASACQNSVSLLHKFFRALASTILMLSLNAFNNQQPLSFHIHIWKKKNQPTLTCPCGQHTTPWSDPPTSLGSSGTGLLPSEVKGRRWTAFLVCSLTGHNHHTERNFLLC